MTAKAGSGTARPEDHRLRPAITFLVPVPPASTPVLTSLPSLTTSPAVRGLACLAGPRPVPLVLWVAAEGSGRPPVAWLSAASPRLGLAKAFLADHHVLLRPSTRPGLSLDQGRTIQIPDWCASRRPRPPLCHHNHTAPISADSLSSGLCHTAPDGLRRMDSLRSLRPVEASHDGGTLLPAMLPCTLQQP